MIGSSVPLFRVLGIEIRVHASWLVVFGLVTWSLAVGYFPVAIPGASTAEAWILGAVAALLLFASVVVHELAHSLVANARGLPVRSITLFIFGGVSNLTSESKKPSTEFFVSVVGPISSFVIAGIAFVVASLVSEPRVSAVFGYLALINALLGAFNLIPGFPLDGGRVLRSIVWKATNSVRRGTEIAVRIGQLVAWVFLLWGFLRIMGGDPLGGLWTAALGWFLHGAASASLQQVVADAVLRGVRVKDVFRPEPITVRPDQTVADVVDHVLLPLNQRGVPVADGRLLGIVTAADVRDVPEAERAGTPVSEIMGGREHLVTIGPNESLQKALEALRSGDYEQLPVVENGRLLGLLTRADLIRAIQLREEIGVGAS